MEIDGEHERAQRTCQSDRMAVEAVALMTVSVLASTDWKFDLIPVTRYRYSITSSAFASSDCDTVRPRALAVQQ
jgi:hypothetical protein